MQAAGRIRRQSGDVLGQEGIGSEGLAVFERLDEPIDRRDRELMARLTEAELQSLLAILEEVGEPE